MPPRLRREPVQEQLDARQAGQEVDGQDGEHDERGSGAEHDHAGAEDAAGDRATAAGDQLGQPLLQVIADVESAQLGVRVAQRVQVVRQVAARAAGWLASGGMAARTKAASTAAAPATTVRTAPSGAAPAGQPADDRVEPGRDEQREADEHQH